MTEASDEPEPPRSLEPLIRAADSGDAEASTRLFALLYDELHRLAESQLRRMHPHVGLSATTLLHDLYIAMHPDGSDAPRAGQPAFPDRGRFMAYAARAMRRIVIDAIRARRADKRGGQFHITALSYGAGEIPDHAGAAGASVEELERLGDALDILATTDPALAEIVNLNFFDGLSFEEIAALRGVSERTVQRDWRKARLFLKSALMES